MARFGLGIARFFGLGSILFLVQANALTPQSLAQTVSNMPPAASERVPPKQPVASSNGSYSTSVNIVVPGFRGLEPKIKLTYDSSRSVRYEAGRSNQLLGIGWSLQGVSTVERATPGRGAPRYDNNDIFMLDRSELVDCSIVTGPSASCSNGGTHSTRIESYRRIVFDAGVNEWNVWSRDGTKFTYQSLGLISGIATPANLANNYRWRLTEATDTSGNKVTYQYNCASLPNCYPQTVSYNGTEIKFWREARPAGENIVYATGEGLGQVADRIRAVTVSTGGTLVRAYGLSYEQSPSTKLSRLIKVQEFGRDAIVDTNGNITNAATASSLPASEFTYSNDSQSLVTSSWTGAESGYWGLPGEIQQTRLVADFNGDGRSDVAYIRAARQFHSGGSNNADYYSCAIRVSKLLLSNGSGFDQIITGLPTYTTNSNNYGGGPQNGACSIGGLEQGGKFLSNFTVGDFDGDGKSDIGFAITRVVVDNNGEAPQYAASAFFHMFSAARTYRSMGQIPGEIVTSVQAAGDLQNDGKTDLLITYYSAFVINNGFPSGNFGTLAGNVTLAVSQGNSMSSTGVINLPSSFRAEPGDFNGDGKGDLVVLREISSSTAVTQIYLSNGSQLLSAPQFGGYSVPLSVAAFNWSWAVGDFNGDGRSDLLLKTKKVFAPDYLADMYLSTGQGFVLSNWTSPGTAAHNLLKSGESNRAVIGDFDGDGRSDMLRSFLQSSPAGYFWNGAVSLAGGAYPDLMITRKNIYGGTTTLSYQGSTQTANTLLPFVTQIIATSTTDDGRGTSESAATTVFDYEAGAWNWPERRFLGFGSVAVTLPKIASETTAPTIDLTFRQDIAIAGALDSLSYKTGDGTELRRFEQQYTINNTLLPFTGLNHTTLAIEKGGTTTTTTTQPVASCQPWWWGVNFGANRTLKNWPMLTGAPVLFFGDYGTFALRSHCKRSLLL